MWVFNYFVLFDRYKRRSLRISTMQHRYLRCKTFCGERRYENLFPMKIRLFKFMFFSRSITY